AGAAEAGAEVDDRCGVHRAGRKRDGRNARQDRLHKSSHHLNALVVNRERARIVLPYKQQLRCPCLTRVVGHSATSDVREGFGDFDSTCFSTFESKETSEPETFLSEWRSAAAADEARLRICM